jgi:hypothetical protein
MLMKIIDINNKEREVVAVYINSEYEDFVEALFSNDHVEWFQKSLFEESNPDIELKTITFDGEKGKIEQIENLLS